MLETVRIRQSGYSSKFTFQVNLLSLLPFCLYCSKQLVHSAQCFFFFYKMKKKHSCSFFLCNLQVASTSHIDPIYIFFQEFVRHFHVLMPRGTTPTKSGIREFFRRIHIPPAAYQVGNTKVSSGNPGFGGLTVGLICPSGCRCSCGRWSASASRHSCIRRCCGGSSRSNAASEPF